MAEKCACNSIWDSLLPGEAHTKICQSRVSSRTLGTADVDKADHTDLQRIDCDTVKETLSSDITAMLKMFDPQ